MPKPRSIKEQLQWEANEAVKGARDFFEQKPPKKNPSLFRYLGYRWAKEGTIIQKKGNYII